MPRVWPWPSCWASGSAGSGTRCVRTTCRSSCSARACCGSAGSASTPARRSAPTVWPVSRFVNTAVATGAAICGWIAVEYFRDKKGTSLGAASGAVAGLVAITPAAGSISPFGSIVLGIIAGVLCALAVGLKYKLGYDDSLDVVGVHLVGGLVGTLLIGFLAVGDVGLFYGGSPSSCGSSSSQRSPSWPTRSSSPTASVS